MNEKDEKDNKRKKPKRQPRRVLPAPPALGVQIEGRAEDQQRWLGAHGVVKLRASWAESETPDGSYHWEALDEQIGAVRGQALLLQVFGTPAAYRIIPGAICSPPQAVYLPRLVNFTLAMVKRYQPLAVEVWNEPETSAGVAQRAGVDGLLGGFGTEMAAYYGRVVRAIGQRFLDKRLSCWLLAGGLGLMDETARFWRIARPVCAGHYDAVSYHSYSSYPTMDFELPGRKASWLRAVPGAERDKLWVTETALTAHEDTETFRVIQAEYLNYIEARREIWKIKTLVWYPLANNGWMCTDLVRKGEPTPAWERYQALTA
jgi:hypothetical protein